MAMPVYWCPTVLAHRWPCILEGLGFQVYQEAVEGLGGRIVLTTGQVRVWFEEPDPGWQYGPGYWLAISPSGDPTRMGGQWGIVEAVFLAYGARLNGGRSACKFLHVSTEPRPEQGGLAIVSSQLRQGIAVEPLWHDLFAATSVAAYRLFRNRVQCEVITGEPINESETEQISFVALADFSRRSDSNQLNELEKTFVRHLSAQEGQTVVV